jgi:hypothetical protein
VLCLFGKHRTEDSWLAVVPKQECTGASVEVEDFGPALELLTSRGYRKVGTIHTHPGGGSQCSGIDTGDTLWGGEDRFSGVHGIIGKTSGDTTFYYCMGGETFKLGGQWKRKNLWKKRPEDIPVQTISLLAEDSTYDISKMITKPEPKIIQFSGGYWIGGKQVSYAEWCKSRPAPGATQPHVGTPMERTYSYMNNWWEETDDESIRKEQEEVQNILQGNNRLDATIIEKRKKIIESRSQARVGRKLRQTGRKNMPAYTPAISYKYMSRSQIIDVMNRLKSKDDPDVLSGYYQVTIVYEELVAAVNKMIITLEEQSEIMPNAKTRAAIDDLWMKMWDIQEEVVGIDL